MMIVIRKSPTADSRTCDYQNVTKDQLLESSVQHIRDVSEAMRYFGVALSTAALVHDADKVSGIDWFHSDFVTGFKETGWWDNHRKINRHHLDHEDGIPSDVNLVDVLEYVCDCVMAGMARSGDVYPLKITDEILRRAFENTVQFLKSRVKVVES